MREHAAVAGAAREQSRLAHGPGLAAGGSASSRGGTLLSPPGGAVKPATVTSRSGPPVSGDAQPEMYWPEA
jgi:hypothetical protein